MSVYKIMKLTATSGGTVNTNTDTLLGIANVKFDLGNGYTGTLTFPSAALDACPASFTKTS